MKKNHITRDSIIVGLALFSTMFGAGNLIFPPQIGLADGTLWGWGALGIVLTGVILPVAGLLGREQRWYGRQVPHGSRTP